MLPHEHCDGPHLAFGTRNDNHLDKGESEDNDYTASTVKFRVKNKDEDSVNFFDLIGQIERQEDSRSRRPACTRATVLLKNRSLCSTSSSTVANGLAHLSIPLWAIARSHAESTCKGQDSRQTCRKQSAHEQVPTAAWLRFTREKARHVLMAERNIFEVLPAWKDYCACSTGNITITGDVAPRRRLLQLQLT